MKQHGFFRAPQSAAKVGFVSVSLLLLLLLLQCNAMQCYAMQPQRYAGLILLAPMISLEKLKRKGLNPILL
jgi:hypothetical protein